MATMKKAAPKAQKGKKVDGNTNAQKLMLDNKYNSIYRSMKNDSIKESNKSLPSTYERLRRANAGKSPSAAKLRSAQDDENKAFVQYSKANKLNTKLDAKGRTENAMKNFAMNSFKSGGVVKKAQSGVTTKKTSVKKVPVKKVPTSKPGMNTIVPGGGRNFYDIDMSRKDKISPVMSRKGASIKKAQKGTLVKSAAKLKKK